MLLFLGIHGLLRHRLSLVAATEVPTVTATTVPTRATVTATAAEISTAAAISTAPATVTTATTTRPAVTVSATMLAAFPLFAMAIAFRLRTMLGFVVGLFLGRHILVTLFHGRTT